MSNKNLNRKDFIKHTLFAGAAVSLAPFNIIKGKDKSKVRLGFIGTGLRGTSHISGFVGNFSRDVEIPALCDKSKSNAEIAQGIISKGGMKAPEIYSRDEVDYKRMLERDDLDGVIIAAPWLWHVPIAVAAMKSNCKFVGVEVPGAITLEGCWDLVKTSEATGTPCMMLENACYSRPVLAILNMVRKGMFGSMVHARCAYNHDLLYDTVLLDEKGNFGPGTGNYNHGEGGESNWRTKHHINRNGDLYPTHGIGPVAHWLDINRGNRFKTISSTSTKSRRLHDEIVKRGGKIALRLISISAKAIWSLLQ